jgi:hypothetical protein
MGYYMRFISTDTRPITPAELRSALVAADPGYDIEVDDIAATINHSGVTIAHVEINIPGDGLFDEERDELVEFATDSSDDRSAMARVVATLRSARSIVAAQVLFGTGDAEQTLARLDPLWAWLLQNRQGLVQADSEGYYDARGMVLKVD